SPPRSRAIPPTRWRRSSRACARPMHRCRRATGWAPAPARSRRWAQNSGSRRGHRADNARQEEEMGMSRSNTTDPAVDLQDFRREVRQFVQSTLPAATRDKVGLGLELTKAEIVHWQRCLRERGWLAPHWPVQWRGCGWSPAQRAAFQEELVANHAPEMGGITF